ncbi:hypothetical protein M514_07370 [Trichuris suis]|uniref:Uncharacterized protein n=1 Tax=Trichuris suis TaxID=68888 RepID=A0A085NC63_9BILA|nr:hypothetical protein M513_07370 [Trichuris suis]KFD67059.1 hypothetical protein M514_07370 [Trichuris suis]
MGEVTIFFLWRKLGQPYYGLGFVSLKVVRQDEKPLLMEGPTGRCASLRLCIVGGLASTPAGLLVRAAIIGCSSVVINLVTSQVDRPHDAHLLVYDAVCLSSPVGCPIHCDH